jgi:AraC family transcriptional regulator
MKKAAHLITSTGKNQEEYVRRINIALAFISEHLDESIQLEDVAAASYFSVFHFHRLFHGIVGETVNDYITRKRMELAAKRLVYNPNISVTQVSEMGGFFSSANFSKAFKLYFGVSPSELRNPINSEKSKIGKLYSKYGKEFDPKALYSQFVTYSGAFNPDKLKEQLMKVKVKEMPEQSIAYLSSPNGYVLESVYSTWEKVLNWAENMDLDTGINKRYAICHDNPSVTPENKCRYDAAIVVGSDIKVAAPYSQSMIPAGKYAVSYYKDVAEKINNFITELCAQWFPDSGFEPDNFPLMFQYLNDSREDDSVEMDIYIKVKALGVGT